MEILNPNAIKLKQHHDKRQVFISFRTNGVGLALSKAAMVQFVLRPGMLITFVIEFDRLYFYLSSKEGEGFTIVGGRHESGLICSKLLVRYIYERLPAAKRNGSRYLVRVSNTRINDSATFEILLDKRI